MMRKTEFAFWTFLLMTGLAAATTLLNVTRSFSATSSNSELYRQLDLFGDVLERVRSDYVDKPDDPMLIESSTISAWLYCALIRSQNASSRPW